MRGLAAQAALDNADTSDPAGIGYLPAESETVEGSLWRPEIGVGGFKRSALPMP